MCSSVRPSRSTCVRAAAIRRSMSALPTTRPSISVLAVNVLDFSRPHATARNTLFHRHACRPLGLRHGGAHRLLRLVAARPRARPSGPAWAATPTPNTRTATRARVPRLGTAAITQTVLLVPMSSSPTTSSACLLDPRLAATRPTPTLAQMPPVATIARPQLSCRPDGSPATRARSVRPATRRSISLAPARAAACANARLPRQRLGDALRRQLDGAAADQPQRPAPLADALGNLDAGGTELDGRQASAKSPAASAAAPSPATRGSDGAAFAGTAASTRPVLSIR